MNPITMDQKIIGQIDLLAFPGARKTRAGECMAEEGVFIPRSANPTIFFCTSGSRRAADGSVIPAKDKAYLDLELHRTAANRYGNDFYARPAVGRSNREAFGLTDEEIRAVTPIIGNFKYDHREQPAPVQETQRQQTVTPPPPAEYEPYTPISDYNGEDMPDFTDDGEDIFD